MSALLVTETRYAAGVDIGGTEGKAVVVEMKDGSLPRIVPGSDCGIPSEVASGPGYVTSVVVPGALNGAIERSGIRKSLIKSVGVDFPCAVSVAEGKTLDVANMKHPEWRGFSVRSAIVESIRSYCDFSPKVIAVDNDAAATMYGLVFELPKLEQGLLNVGFFVGTGLGGAALMNQVNRFNNQSGGSEPGATKFSYDEGPILYGRPEISQLRRLEEFVSLTAIERQLCEMFQRGIIPLDHPLLRLEAKGSKGEWRVRAENLLGFADRALSSGNFEDFSVSIFKVQQEVLGIYIQSLIQWERPANIFIGGGVVDSRRVSSEFANWYLAGVRERAIELIAQPARRELGIPQFRIPTDGDFAAPKGAALMSSEPLL